MIQSVAKKSKPAETEPVGRGRREPDASKYSGRVAARLRELREKRGTSVADLAVALNERGVKCTTKAIYHWETGTAAPPLDALPAIADALGVTLRKLLPDA